MGENINTMTKKAEILLKASKEVAMRENTDKTLLLLLPF
jgi:hypothetical protein